MNDGKETPAGARVQVVIVTWNSAAHVASALRSLPADCPAVVVDNASSDSSAAIAEELGAETVRLPGNIGFGPAVNLGSRTGLGAACQAILILNPDAALRDGEGCLQLLLGELDADPNVAAAAPALLGDGQERFQLRRLPTLGSLAREAFLVNRLRPDNAGLLRERYLDVPRSAPFDVEQPAAAALLVRRGAFEAIGGFDPAFAPAWFEDVDLCARLLEAGGRIRFVPAARASHEGGVSMRALPYRDFLPLYTRNLLRYASRHFSPVPRALTRLLSGAGALLRLSLLPFVRGDHGRRDAAAAYIRVLQGVLGLGWRSSLIPAEGNA